MTYRLFLFDLDDTLLDFKASEQRSFLRTMQALGVHDGLEPMFEQYQAINLALWQQVEAGSLSQDQVKVQRFRTMFATLGLDLDAEAASSLYLECLATTVVLIDGAIEVCQALAAVGQVGIITNGIDAIQQRRIASSGLAPHIAFVATSQACGYAKPDVRFFEYAAAMAAPFAKQEAILIGDRLDADILGANRYGIDSCWFNPQQLPARGIASPTYEISRLEQLSTLLLAQSTSSAQSAQFAQSA